MHTGPRRIPWRCSCPLPARASGHQTRNTHDSRACNALHPSNVNPIKVTPALREEIAKRLDDPAASERRALALSVEDDESTYFIVRSVLNEVAPEPGHERAEDRRHDLPRLKQAGHFPHGQGNRQH
jgi:hypothetical protein